MSIFTEIYAAAKETVALAEQRFMSNSHEWQFDNAWQEMLNHATIKVFFIEIYDLSYLTSVLTIQFVCLLKGYGCRKTENGKPR